MADQQHPITPPPELVAKIRSQALLASISQRDYDDRLVIAAYRAGADYELSAILALAKNPGDSDEYCYFDGFTVAGIRRNRRPVPPSLAEEALAQTNAILNDPNRALLTEVRETLELNRHALERLQELEGRVMADTFSFQWEGTTNPNDPSGVALFTVGSESVAIPMNNFEKAEKLRRLIEKACNRSREKVINRTTSGIYELLRSCLYD